VNETGNASELGKVQVWMEPLKLKATVWTDGPFIRDYR